MKLGITPGGGCKPGPWSRASAAAAIACAVALVLCAIMIVDSRLQRLLFTSGSGNDRGWDSHSYKRFGQTGLVSRAAYSDLGTCIACCGEWFAPDAET